MHNIFELAAVMLRRTSILLYLIVPIQSCADLEVEYDSDSGIGAAEEEIRGGSNWSPILGFWENIGAIVTPYTPTGGTTFNKGCTATIVSEYAALTAAHCGDDGATSTFTGFNSRGTITGTFTRYSLYNFFNWAGHDYAVVRFNTSIHNSMTFNGSGLSGFPVHERFVPTTTDISLFGTSNTNQACNAGGGTLNFAWNLTMTSFSEDWQYKLTSATFGACPGDSGGPDVAYVDGEYKVVAVNSWIVGNDSHFKPTYMASRWIYENSARADLPGDTWGHCRLYDTDIGGSAYSIQEHQDKTDLSTIGWNNRASAIWVKKGYEFKGYDGTNYTTYLGTGEGFAAGFSKCNEYGCYHDLTGTSMDDDITSIRCDSALPQSTWGNCILYDHGPDWSYLSFQGNHASFSSSGWNNRASQIWVKDGYTAMVYPEENYQANGYWGYSAFSGSSSGEFCNAYGCFYDLVDSANESTISSIQCLGS